MRLLRFFAGYLTGYVPWLVAAALAVAVYGLATVAMVSLIEPIFGEVLLAGNEAAEAIPGLTIGKDSPNPGSGAAAGSGAASGGLTGTASALNLKVQVDRVYQALKRKFHIDSKSVLYFTPTLFVLVFLIRGLANFCSGYAFQHIGLGVTTDVRNDLYRALLRQSPRFHSIHNSGELVSRVVNDVAVMQTAVTTRLLDLVQQSVTLVFLLYLLLSTNFSLALICLFGMPLVLFPIYRFGRGMRKTSHRTQERIAEVTAILAEGIRGHRVVRAFGAEDFEYRRFKVATDRHRRISLWAQVLSNLSSPVTEAISTIALAAFLIYAGAQIRSGTLSPPLLVQFLANLMLLYDPIRKLNKVNLVLQQAMAAAHNVTGLLDEPNEIVEAPHPIPFAEIREGIRFEGVTFGYGEEPVLHDVSLDIPKGSLVALVGPSGAGKSSLVNLLPRFFDPNQGRVTIDGRDIRDFDLKSLRESIGIVSQETTLFHDTVRNNIAYAAPETSQSAVESAARAAYADEFIERVPLGYEASVGEAGLQLSGGQRQRIAIARAILKNAPVLILDEATSQLDSESEALVQKALANLMVGRTTLVIAHRLATVIRADCIAVMQEGRIVESGTHQELLDAGGVYRRLFELQFLQKDSA